MNCYFDSLLFMQIYYRFKFISRTFSTAKEDSFEFLYGINPIQSALKAGRRKFDTLYISDSEHIELSSKAVKIMNEAKIKNIPTIFTHKDKLSRLVKNQPHQNLVLKCSQLPLLPIPLKPFSPGVYVYCDKITDPQNFGAILRSCLFFGVSHVFTGKKQHCPLNSTVSKTSAGAAELIQTHLVENSKLFVEKWKKQGGTVLATSVNNQRPHTGCHELNSLLKKQRIDKTLLIIGSEGNGVSQHLVSASDYCVTIERHGEQSDQTHLVDSLNVSAALSVLLYEITRA